MGIKLKIPNVTGYYSVNSGVRQWHWFVYKGSLKLRIMRVVNSFRSKYTNYDAFGEKNGK